MNRDVIASSWNDVKGTVRERWSKLTTDDVTRISGRRELLVSTLQDRYGWTPERAEAAVSEFERSYTESHAGSGTR